MESEALYSIDQDVEALQDYYLQTDESQTQTTKVLPESTGKLTLADIKRRTVAEQETIRDETHLKRFRIVNYTSEDSQARHDIPQLRTYYCSICGTHALVTQAEIDTRPTRETDGSFVFEEEVCFSKIYVLPDERILIRRAKGIECQYRFKCKSCGFSLGYRETPFDAKYKKTYIFPDALVSSQKNATALRTAAQYHMSQTTHSLVKT